MQEDSKHLRDQQLTVMNNIIKYLFSVISFADGLNLRMLRITPVRSRTWQYETNFLN